MDIQEYSEQIKKTGFVLEYQLVTALKKDKWTVISNKYYEDDLEGTVREIDVLAYKVKKVDGIKIYTVLMISCKKSDECAWVLLSRKLNPNEPNSNWKPLHIWSSSKEISYEIDKSNFSEKYHSHVEDNYTEEPLSIPATEVFAFQEMNKINKVPKNDKNIFSSITSLIKSQAYEMDAFSKKNKKNCIYQFNLLSVMDTDLIRLDFRGDKISEEEIESEHYISRYIVKRKETFSRIRFVHWPSFERILKDYSSLHKANSEYFEKLKTEFYIDVVKDFKKTLVLIDEFRDSIRWALAYSIEKINWRQEFDYKKVYLSWNNRKNLLEVDIAVGEEFIRELNQSEQALKKVKDSLLKIYRYDGDFVFAEESIPF